MIRTDGNGEKMTETRLFQSTKHSFTLPQALAYTSMPLIMQRTYRLVKSETIIVMP